jgi:hypothetical protein
MLLPRSMLDFHIELRWESIKGVQIVRQAEGISFQGPGEDEMKKQQRIDPEIAWVVRWRETGEEPTEGELFLGDSRSKYYWIKREVIWTPLVLSHLSLFPASPVETQISVTLGPISSSS